MMSHVLGAVVDVVGLANKKFPGIPPISDMGRFLGLYPDHKTPIPTSKFDSLVCLGCGWTLLVSWLDVVLVLDDLVGFS